MVSRTFSFSRIVNTPKYVLFFKGSKSRDINPFQVSSQLLSSTRQWLSLDYESSCRTRCTLDRSSRTNRQEHSILESNARGWGKSKRGSPPPLPLTLTGMHCKYNELRAVIINNFRILLQMYCTVQYSALTFKEKYQELIVDNLQLNALIL